MTLPDFSLDEYRGLIDRLRAAGFSCRPVSSMPGGESRSVYLRHDVDFDPQAALSIAEVERDSRCQATYYVLLSQHYNPLQLDNRRALSRLIELGHEIGLHYDMETYPTNPAEARDRLDWEAQTLSAVVGAPVRTITMHQPSLGGPDPFRRIDEYVHPHDPRHGDDVMYVSDSCRTWRDRSLLTAWGMQPPQRILLNTHPELWLDGEITDSMAYLNGLRDLVSNRYRRYFDEDVRQRWLARGTSTGAAHASAVQERVMLDKDHRQC